MPFLTRSLSEKWSPGPNWEERAGGRSVEEETTLHLPHCGGSLQSAVRDTREPPEELPSTPEIARTRLSQRSATSIDVAELS